MTLYTDFRVYTTSVTDRIPFRFQRVCSSIRLNTSRKSTVIVKGSFFGKERIKIGSVPAFFIPFSTCKRLASFSFTSLCTGRDDSRVLVPAQVPKNRCCVTEILGLYGDFSDRYLGLKNSKNTRHQNFLTCLCVLGIFGLLRGNPASFISAVVLSPESP